MSPQRNNRRFSDPARRVAEIAVMAAVLEAGKNALAFLPNVEIVTLLIILYTLHFGGMVFPVIAIYVACETMIWGFGLWVVMYAYVWPLLAGIVLLLRRRSSHVLWIAVSGIFGLLYGALCAPVYVVGGGWSRAVAWWIAGLPFDLIHCGGNVVIALVLFVPLDRLLERFAPVKVRAADAATPKAD